ncbi:MAG: protein-L-isoaspartate(D-aspartate) O-methyltransferase [Betaproteobacteria bacterium]|nr:MAG: protein-L-isoaspartate(D-aspartate) O-methyltransferase [Betaproteobacteria bacterium]
METNADDLFDKLRRQMVADITAHTVFACAEIGKAALSARVMEAMGQIPRHEFVPAEIRAYAYADTPLPIGCNKTISQPFIVALMTDLLDPQAEDRVLEIGTGLGYQAAVLSGLVRQVYSVEVIEELARQAKKRLARLRLRNVELRTANGYYGWPEHAPYDKIVLTAAPELIPPALLQQLKPGGKMVLPAGLPDTQKLLVVEKAKDGRIATRELLRVRFSLMEVNPASEASPRSPS